jgi:hypothetical protein
MNPPDYDFSVTLFTLPDESKAKIDKEFGSIAKLYMIVYDKEKKISDLKWNNMDKSKMYERFIDESIEDIQQRLDKLGIQGFVITINIAEDFAANTYGNGLQTPAFFKEKFGSSYEEMKEWLESNITIKRLVF